MQLIEVIDAARILLSEPLDAARSFPDNTSSFWTDSQLIVYHNLVQQELMNDVISVHEDYFVTASNLSIVAGTSDYSLPAGTIKVRRVEDIRNSSAPLEIRPTQLNDRGYTVLVRTLDTARGGYYIRGNQIVFENTPTYTDSSAVRLTFIKAISDVTAATNSSELPVEHHGALVWGTYRLCLIQQQSSPESLNLATGEYEKKRREMKTQLENRQTQRVRRVVRTYERGYI